MPISISMYIESDMQPEAEKERARINQNMHRSGDHRSGEEKLV